MRLHAAVLAGVVLIASPVSAQRLPAGIAPEHYDLAFVVDLAHERFDGTETIGIDVAAPTARIVLNAVDIDFREVTVGSGAGAQKATATSDATSQTATFTVPRPIAAGKTDVHIRYAGALNSQLRGFYISKSKARKYAATQFESTDARRAFPSFDEPAYKATFDISAVVDKDDTAISNYPIASDTPGPAAGKHNITFKTTPKMSSYLVALVVGNFEYVEGSSDGVPIRVWTTPGKKQLGKYALQVGEECIKYFDNYFGIKYPFEKLDLIGLPDFAAG